MVWARVVRFTLIAKRWVKHTMQPQKHLWRGWVRFKFREGVT